MSNTVIIWLMIGFIVKHFICDFVLQFKYQWSNKHILGHPGGILHAAIHSVGTLAVGFACSIDFQLIGILALVEGIIHYFIDYAKMNINIHYGWGSNTHSQFWILTGLDQLLHYMCYVGIIAILI